MLGGGELVPDLGAELPEQAEDVGREATQRLEEEDVDEVLPRRLVVPAGVFLGADSPA